MLSERNLDRRILQELINYFFSVGVDELRADLSISGGYLAITVEGEIRMAEEVDIPHLNRILNNGRKAEVEGYYAQLIGIDQTDNDLELLADLIDAGEAAWIGDRLRIRVWRE